VSRTLARRHGEGHAGALPVEAARHLLDAVVALDGSWPDAYPLSLADQLAVGFDGDVWCTLQLERLTGRTTLGSAVWLSPEHLRGAPRDAAARVYEVAVRLYRLLAGQPPFSAPDAEPGRETTALISAALQPARVPLRTARPDIDDAVAAVLDAAVHVEPARRPSLLALRDALPSSPRSAELWASLLNELFPAEAEEAARFWEEAALAQLDGGVRREPVEVIAPSHDAVGDTQHLLEVQLTRT
jgi:serine/threonine protein kinase